MSHFKEIQTIVFDWDGTLHESMHIYKPAFLRAYQSLVDLKAVPNKAWSDDEIKSFLGMNPKDMWAKATPDLSAKLIEQASQMISESMLESITKGEAVLYPHALEILEYLKSKGYHLVYLSNSKLYYMNAMEQAFNLCEYFDIMICSEMYQFLPKKIILERIMSSIKKPFVVIGDRKLDIETGVYNHGSTIGCLYGYGNEDELKDATLNIHNLYELNQIF
jgi:phosphoglycolate phosphatase